MNVEWIQVLKTSRGDVRVIRGTGITIEAYRSMRANGITDEELLRRYPQLSPMHLEYLDKHLELST